MCKSLEKQFGKQYHMKVLGEIKHILGMDVDIDPVTHVVHMSQAEYIRKSVSDNSKYGPNDALDTNGQQATILQGSKSRSRFRTST